jgi:membrane protein implicated in regulation of membrane protease activity
MTTIFWIWIAAAVVFLVIELVTPTLIFISFVAGAVCAGVYSQFEPKSYYLQLAIFLLVSLVLLPFTRRLANRISNPSATRSNVDRLIGQVALVTRAIDPKEGGHVKFEGETWSAESQEPIEVDSSVRIVAVKGTHLHVERAEPERTV